MRLTGEEELYGIVRIVHEALETLEVGEQQVCTFVGCETATETDNQRGRVHLIDSTHDTCRIALRLHPVLLELMLDIIDQSFLEVHTCAPDHLIRYVEVITPHIQIRLVVPEALREILLIYFLPLRSRPGRHVYTIRYVTYMQLLWIVTFPYGREHLLAHLAVQPRYTVCLLAGVQGEYGHRELLAAILRISTSETDEVTPLDAEFVGIGMHILVEQAFLEIVVTCRNRCMAGI